MTVAVTLFALLELYKQGEATWTPGRARSATSPSRPMAAHAGARGGARRERAGPHARGAALPVPRAGARRPTWPTAAECAEDELAEALAELRDAYAPGARGVVLRELAGGFTLASDPEAEPAARRLLARPRTPPLTPAQAETLAIVAYLQPVSRPEITRIRGVSADSASATLLERGLIEEAGRSQFGAVLYRTTPLFLKLFGLASLDDLPDPSQWDPTPDEEADLRDRLLKAGEARTRRLRAHLSSGSRLRDHPGCGRHRVPRSLGP